MQHRRHYTVAEANALRHWVAGRVARLRTARERLVASERAADVAAEATVSGGAWPGRDEAGAAVEWALGMEDLDRLEIVVRDLERGLVDFPALRDGDEVYLCWLVGEPAVAHWHAIGAGFRGRRPL